MNINETIDVFAGGPGSGPNAPCPQCGPTAKDTVDPNRESGEKFKGPKGGPSPEIGKALPLHMPRKEWVKSPPQKLYDKVVEKQKLGTKDMQQWKESQPKIEHKDIKKGEHVMAPGDTVSLKRSVESGLKEEEKQTFPKGTKATIVGVLPRIGNNEQVVTVQIIPKNDPKHPVLEHMKVSDVKVEISKIGEGKEKIGDIKPVPKSQTLQKFETQDGATVTIVKPHAEGVKETKDLSQISQEEHYLKGKFTILDKVAGIQDMPGFKRSTRIFDTSGGPAWSQKGSGATVRVSTYSQKGAVKRVVISEQNYTTYSQKTRGIMSFDYKSAAKAVGMLRQRYGIKLKMGKLV